MQIKYLGVDAGATKTRAVLYHADGSVYRRSTQGHGNIIVNEVEALNNVRAAVAQCLEKIQDDEMVFALVGMAGVQIANKSSEVKRFLQKEFSNIQQLEVINDGYLGMIAGLEGQDGVFVIAGTGSVIYGKKGQDIVRVGGFGHLLGDEGSAYWIGRELFKLFTYFLDSAQTEQAIYQALLLKEGLKEKQAYQLVKKFYNLTKEEVAQYALFVSEQADNGDEYAIGLLKKAGQELASQVQVLLTRLDFTQKIHLSISGSVAVKNKLVLDEMLKRLPFVHFVGETDDVTKAAYYYWQGKGD